MKVIGITGGIGSGKSMITAALREKGYPVIDADQVSRELVEPGSPGLAAIVEGFGPEYLDESGCLDRKKMGARVFSDPHALEILNGILHPLLRRSLKERAEALAGREETVKKGFLFIDAAILIEAGMADLVEEIWLVYADPEVQIARIQERDGFTREEALARIRAQMPLEEKKKRAHRVLDNNGSREKTLEQLEELLAVGREKI